MNRGAEIDSELADDNEISLIRDQVEMGVAVRMATLEALAANLPNMMQSGGMLMSEPECAFINARLIDPAQELDKWQLAGA